jgi:hypothetical protein
MREKNRIEELRAHSEQKHGARPEKTERIENR